MKNRITAVFLTKPSCKLCDNMIGHLKRFVLQHNDVDIVIRNVEFQLTRKDKRVLKVTKLSKTPVIYFETDVLWLAVNPQDYNFAQALAQLRSSVDEFIDYELINEEE